jgi:hypothetical protein
MKVTQAGDQLALHDSPGCFWLLGLFFVTIGSLFVAGPLGLFSNVEEVSAPVRALTLLMGLVAVGTGLYVIDSAPTTHVVLDARTGELRLKRRGLFRRETVEHSLSEIAAVYVEESEDSEGDAVFRPAMKMWTGKEIPLSALWLHPSAGCEGTVETVKEFLAKHEYMA